MAFDLVPSTGLEIKYISVLDPAIDWDTTARDAGFSRDDYIEDASDERIGALIFHDGQTPTTFLLGMPDPRTLNLALKEEEGIGALQYIARRYILGADNLLSGGRPVQLKRTGRKTLDTKSENAIPTQVLHEIGRFLMERGGMADDPFSN